MVAIYQRRGDRRFVVQIGANRWALSNDMSARHLFDRAGLRSRLQLFENDADVASAFDWIAARRLRRPLDSSYRESGRTRADFLLSVARFVNDASLRASVVGHWEPDGSPDL